MRKKERKIKKAEVAARQRALEDDEKYSEYLPEFYDYCRVNSFNDFLKDDFIKEFKQKFALKEINRFSEIGGIVQGCFLEWGVKVKIYPAYKYVICSNIYCKAIRWFDIWTYIRQKWKKEYPYLIYDINKVFLLYA